MERETLRRKQAMEADMFILSTIFGVISLVLSPIL
jgi:hypothetical protein